MIQGNVIYGYYRTESSFRTISEWESIAKKILNLQKKGVDTRDITITDNIELLNTINNYFGYLYNVETENHEKYLTKKMVLNFIEDFANYRIWGFRDEFKDLIPDIDDIKIAFYMSRGDLQPYVLMDENFTKRIYGNTKLIVTTKHWTSLNGFKHLDLSIKTDNSYAISTFTVQNKKFFRPISNYLLTVKGYLIAAFRSDVYTLILDTGNRAANMYRLSYPNHESNLYIDIDDLKENATSLWNEIIIKPIEIVDSKKIITY